MKPVSCNETRHLQIFVLVILRTSVAMLLEGSCFLFTPITVSAGQGFGDVGKFGKLQGLVQYIVLKFS